MLFWVIAGLLALVIGALLLLALQRRAAGGDAPASDIQVYRDQLDEVERDLARGVLAEDEAERMIVVLRPVLPPPSQPFSRIATLVMPKFLPR